MTTGTIAAAVLAAGRGSRLGADAATAKPLLEFRGRPLLAHALEAVLASGLAPVLVIVGHQGTEVGALAPPGVEVVPNEEWAQGISSSLRAALRRLQPRAEVDAVVVGLADQPLVGSDAWRRVGAAGAGGADVAVATYGGRRGNPVLLSRAVWPAALALRGDEGARQLFREHVPTEVPCDGTGSPDDVDTFEDLERLSQGSD